MDLNANRVATYENGNYGEVLVGQGSVYNPYCWNGEPLDAESGLTYMPNRYYQASTGRFIQRDPIGYPGGLRLYGFVNFDTINASDPDGLQTVPAPNLDPSGYAKYKLAKVATPPCSWVAEANPWASRRPPFASTRWPGKRGWANACPVSCYAKATGPRCSNWAITFQEHDGPEPERITIYLDTSVISAYFDDRTPQRRDETRRFWDFSKECQFFVSRAVVREILKTPDLIRRNQMLGVIRGLGLLDLTPSVSSLADDFAAENLVPAKKFEDAQHLALAVVHGVNFLASWNFRHMVNYKTVGKLPMLAAKNGYFKPLAVVTPEFFINTMGQENQPI